MITQSKPIVESWQSQLSQAFRSAEALLDHLKLTHLPFAGKMATANFPVRVPRSFVARMRAGDPEDPLLRQVLPDIMEEKDTPGYYHDPLEERHYNTQTGFIQKYQGRALLLLSTACAINCRYCFRRHFPYADNRLSASQLDHVVERIKADKSIKEIIFSGGDPLLLANHKLANICQQIAAIPQITTLRFHSRVPIVLPARIDTGFIELLNQIDCRKVLVVHSNHANEINHEVIQAMQKIQQQQVLLLNQSVLLAGVNDTPRAITELSQHCFDAGILPYYLHLPDKVANTAHFDVSRKQAISLMQAVSAALPGYLVPKLVQEIPGKSAKQVISYQ